MPYKGGVQLLPETERRPTLASYTSGNSYFYTAVALGIAIIIIGATLGGYKASLRQQIASLDGQLDASEQQRNKTQEQELIAASKQSRVMRQLLAGKWYWSQALERMEQMTQASVALTQLGASATKGTITFRGTADGYAAVARQLAAFVAATGVKDVSLRSVKTNPQGVIEFDGELSIDTRTLVGKPSPSPSTP
ncbi:MAG: hypothetical protein IT406_01825 [Candidatus Yanofskybacteria bacterium]|nr:hypothetical protein [Candidatus Yanofskybacteria bacterium]